MNATGSQMLNIVADAENKRTVAATFKLIDALQKKFYRSGKTSAKVLNCQIAPYMLAFPMEKFHPFFDEFRFQIHRSIEAGVSSFNRNIKNSLQEDEIPPLVLSMDDLGVGFLVCLIPLAVSAVAFIGEVFVSKLIFLSKAIRDVITAFYLAKAFFPILKG